VKPNRERALYWYRQAYRRGLRGTASNIGVLFRDEKNLKQALAWFKRAGDGDAELAIANMFLREKDATKAVYYLERAYKSGHVSRASKEEARRLLNSLKGQRRSVPR
jgi:TPR repeat protein